MTEQTAPVSEETPTSVEGTEQPNQEAQIQETEKKQSFQDRFNQVYGQKKHLERQNQELEERLKALEEKNQPKEPTLESFDYDDDKFQEARIEYKASQMVDRKLQEREELQARQEEQRKAQELTAKFDQKNSGYQANNPEYANLYNQALSSGFIQDIPMDIQNAIAADENGPKMLHALLKDPMQVEQMRTASPVVAGMMLQNLQSSVSVKTVSEAPEPIKTLDGSSTGGREPTKEQLSKMSADEYYAHRMRQPK